MYTSCSNFMNILNFLFYLLVLWFSLQISWFYYSLSIIPFFVKTGFFFDILCEKTVLWIYIKNYFIWKYSVRPFICYQDHPNWTLHSDFMMLKPPKNPTLICDMILHLYKMTNNSKSKWYRQSGAVLKILSDIFAYEMTWLEKNLRGPASWTFVDQMNHGSKITKKWFLA